MPGSLAASFRTPGANSLMRAEMSSGSPDCNSQRVVRSATIFTSSSRRSCAAAGMALSSASIARHRSGSSNTSRMMR
jgi:hypothetical protein